MNFKDVADKLFSKLEKEELDGKVVYYRKRQVYPILNEEGSINWFNFLTGGKWTSLLMAIAFVVIFLGFAFEYHSNLEECTKVMNEFNAAQNITIEYNEYNEGMRLSLNRTINITLGES